MSVRMFAVTKLHREKKRGDSQWVVNNRAGGLHGYRNSSGDEIEAS